MTSETSLALSGGCQCGSVRYRASSFLEWPHLCHCRMCQKAVGGPFAALAPVPLEDFSWTRGAPGVFWSSNAAYRHFCPACGTPLTFGYGAKAWIAVTIGSLDEPGRVPPLRQYGVESRLEWCTPDRLTCLPAQETSVTLDGQPTRIQSYQHPDHDT